MKHFAYSVQDFLTIPNTTLPRLPDPCIPYALLLLIPTHQSRYPVLCDSLVEVITQHTTTHTNKTRFMQCQKQTIVAVRIS